MKSTFLPKRKHARGPIRLALLYTDTFVKDAKNDVGKTKAASFTFTQLTTGAFCILHVTKIVKLVLWEQHIRNQVLQV